MTNGYERFPATKVPREEFSLDIREQFRQLRDSPMLKRMKIARTIKAGDRYRPEYHFVNPENTLNDPNGLCFWEGRWHLFFQARPPEDERVHWGHAVSDDLVHWQDLPYAFGPGPESDCYSGTTLVEDDRVIAMYHGCGLGNMVATARDPLLLNWEKLGEGPVIPFHTDHGLDRPYGVFDPCIWKEGEFYYALSAGIKDFQDDGRHFAENFLFRSRDLAEWEYLHTFIEGDRFTIPGDDGACPYFLPIGDKHILVFFSHMSGGQYLLGYYDSDRQKFLAEDHGVFNFGATFPGGVHAPTAAPGPEGKVIVLFNMNPAKPTIKRDRYLQDFLGPETEGALRDDSESALHHWDQIMTLPRALSLSPDDRLIIEPVQDIDGLRGEHLSSGGFALTANEELVLPRVDGDRLEIALRLEPDRASSFELNVLRSPDGEETTRIVFFRKRGFIYRTPFKDDVRSLRIISTVISDKISHDSILCIDTSRSSTLPDALARPPEQGPVRLAEDEALDMRVFVDRSVVEVFANGSLALSVRVYPGRDDSGGVSLLSRGRDAQVSRFDVWRMKRIY
ncbi:MAG: glycoside hydrolase family 32 protein [Albidovulum sp.]|nr:glycoside hydrolase family 32 protein [Albidovulum sp.]